MQYDIIIQNGRIVDGSGSASYEADIGIGGDRIVAIGDLHGAGAAALIDAKHRIVAPGFIDPHNHAHNEAEGGILEIPSADNMLRQGITTVIAGNCGGSAWPIGKHLDQVDRLEIRQNYATLAGMQTIRDVAVGEERKALPANPTEIAEMQDLIRLAMDEGALGVSNGYYPAYVTVDEIAEVCKAAAERKGIYSCHMRSEGDALLGSVEEMIRVGARAELPVQISHLKTYGARNWWKIDAVLELIERGRKRGVDVMADRYPYTAGYTGILATIPMWMKTEALARGGYESLREPGRRDHVRRGMEDQMDLIGGPHNIMLAPTEPDPRLDGRRLSEYAEEVGKDPVETALDLICREGISCIYFTMSEENIETFYTSPWVFVGSDGHLRIFEKGVSHPRNYGTFPRFIGRYARDRGLLSVEEAVRKCTGMAAERWGLEGRGRIERGCFADVVVFDWDGIADRATFENQHRYPDGIDWVLLNGRIAVADGETAEGAHGRVLRSTDGP